MEMPTGDRAYIANRCSQASKIDLCCGFVSPHESVFIHAF